MSGVEKISVIIPVYNSEKYLLPTLNSVRFQTYQNLEIICVLDCPTDNSEKIVRAVAKEDNRIKVVSNPQNLGLPQTRNNGIRNATGEYIHFMDSDDLISYDFYETLLNTALKTNAEVISCSVFNEKKPKQSILYLKDEVFLGEEKIHKSEVLYRGWAWRYLIKKSFWDENNFSFPDLVPMEDIVVSISVVHLANKFAVCSDAIYFYKYHDTSILSSTMKEDNLEKTKRSQENVRSAKRMIEDLIQTYKIKRPNKRFLKIKERAKGKTISLNDPIEYGKIETKISVIMPVYNVEKHLTRALNSIRFQTYQNIEIICVLDCPTDSSAEIASKIASEDSRIKLITNSSNKGLPAARNSGIEHATGEYIHFMDSDDFLSPDFYEVLISAAEKSKTDVAACSVFYEKKPRKSIWFQKSECLTDVDSKMEKTEVTMRGWAWKYLIKKSFWNSHNLYFPDLVPMEDKPVMISMIYYANKVALCPAAVYFYKNRENSILNKNYDVAREKQRRANRYKAREIYTDFMKKNNIKQPSKLKYYLSKYIS
jgi:glycosyltransferase involved in cell wall biosynthesis